MDSWTANAEKLELVKDNVTNAWCGTAWRSKTHVGVGDIVFDKL